MLDQIDVKIFGIFGIVLILVIGYFTYLMYQDLVFLKKDLSELKSKKTHDLIEEEEENDWEDEEDDDEELESELTEEEQDEILDQHLASFMENEAAKHQRRVRFEEVHDEEEHEEIEMQEMTQDMSEPEVEVVFKQPEAKPAPKKRGRKAKVDVEEVVYEEPAQELGI
jgi:FtsZ-interacting cell division protein ZipA